MQKIGIGICWDQWFPEAARIMALNGAELLFYPTAIGSEPDSPDMDSRRLVAVGDARPCRGKYTASHSIK
jgi:Predicted amidohydrolase